MFNADRFRRWLAGVILPPEVAKETASATLTQSEFQTSEIKLTPVFTPTGPRVRVKRVKKPKLAKHPKADANRDNRKGRPKNPRDL